MDVAVWINAGTVYINVANPDATRCSYNLVPSRNIFSNTCPLMVNYHAGGTGAGLCPASTANIVAGLYIDRAPVISFAGINLANSALMHPLTSYSRSAKIYRLCTTK